MTKHKMINLILSILMVASMLLGGSSQAIASSAGSPAKTGPAVPIDPTDGSKVPHYYGPYSNYANSSFTLADVAVQITGDGAGATATAAVGGDGAITSVTVTNPGSGYTAATVAFSSAMAPGPRLTLWLPPQAQSPQSMLTKAAPGTLRLSSRLRAAPGSPSPQLFLLPQPILTM